MLLAVFSVIVAPRLQARFGSLKVLGGSLVLLAADVLVLGYGSHTTAIVCTILSGAFIGVNNTVYTELALGVSDAPRPVASAGYNFVRWFAAAAAPYFAPKIEEWTDIHIPFAVAAVDRAARRRGGRRPPAGAHPRGGGAGARLHAPRTASRSSRTEPAGPTAAVLTAAGAPRGRRRTSRH